MSRDSRGTLFKSHYILYYTILYQFVCLSVCLSVWYVKNYKLAIALLATALYSMRSDSRLILPSDMP